MKSLYILLLLIVLFNCTSSSDDASSTQNLPDIYIFSVDDDYSSEGQYLTTITGNANFINELVISDIIGSNRSPTIQFKNNNFLFFNPFDIIYMKSIGTSTEYLFNDLCSDENSKRAIVASDKFVGLQVLSSEGLKNLFYSLDEGICQEFEPPVFDPLAFNIGDYWNNLYYYMTEDHSNRTYHIESIDSHTGQLGPVISFDNVIIADVIGDELFVLENNEPFKVYSAQSLELKRTGVSLNTFIDYSSIGFKNQIIQDDQILLRYYSDMSGRYDKLLAPFSLVTGEIIEEYNTDPFALSENLADKGYQNTSITAATGSIQNKILVYGFQTNISGSYASGIVYTNYVNEILKIIELPYKIMQIHLPSNP